MLVQEKVNQAKRLLAEFDLDCWLTFARRWRFWSPPT